MAKAETLPFEVLAQQGGVLASTLAAVKAAKGWPTGRLMSQKAFDKAINDVTGERFDAPVETVNNGE